jgi:hypothetical protein
VAAASERSLFAPEPPPKDPPDSVEMLSQSHACLLKTQDAIWHFRPPELDIPNARSDSDRTWC